MSMDDENGQRGYYQEIARAFLKRRSGGFFLSPKDQAVIAIWEDKRIPLSVILEGISRTFDGIKERGGGTKTISLAFCDRQVEAAFAQHRERAAGRKGARAAGRGLDKGDRARREIKNAIEALPADGLGITRLLQEALETLSAPRPDIAALERIDAEIDEALWMMAPTTEKAGAEADVRKGLRGRKPPGLADVVRRCVIMKARARGRIPYASLHHH
jgi:hypothetical protein